MDTFTINGKFSKTFDFKRTALIMIDVQNDFIDGVLGTPKAEEALKVINEIAKLPFGYYYGTMDTHYEHDYFSHLEGKYLPVPHCIFESKGWRTPDSFRQILKDEKVLLYVKETFGSIELSPHISYLWKDRLIDAVVVVGFCTDICVISNVLMLKAFTCGDLPIMVVEDGCAGVTESRHQAALEVMKSCHIDVIKKEDLFKNV